jgi:hypothetical protein
MGLSNAERQARWRQRQKARLAETLRNATDAALRQENEALRNEVAALKRALVEAQRHATPEREQQARGDTAGNQGDAALSTTAQQKLDAAIRQHRRKLDAEYAERLRNLDEEVRQKVIERTKKRLEWLEEKEKEADETIALYRKFTNNHRPAFTRDGFRTILMCLHPDGERTKEKLNEAFRLFNDKKLQLTGGK